MKFTLALIMLFKADAQQEFLIRDFANAMSNFKPMWDELEPYKVADINIERGVPSVHKDIGKYI